MKTKILFFILLPCIFILTGCYDQREIDETAYAIALGIDKNKDNSFDYTFQFTTPLIIPEQDVQSSRENTKKESDTGILTITAPDFYLAKNMTNNHLAKNVDMSHLKLLVISDNVNPDDIESHSRLLLRERQIRPHTAISLSAGSAADFLKNSNPEQDTNTSKHYELMSLRSNNVYSPTTQLHSFVDSLPNDTVLPVAITGELQQKFPKSPPTPGWVSVADFPMPRHHSALYGMAIYKKGILQGALDGDNALVYNLLTGGIKSCNATLQNKYNAAKTFSIRLNIPKKPIVNIDLASKEITIDHIIQAELQSGVLPEGFTDASDLQNYIRAVLTHRITDFLTLISRTENADILNFRNLIRKNFSTIEQWNNFDWNSFYHNAIFVVNVNLL